jgi:hypothetical protein
MDVLLGIFTAFGLSASAGLNAYIPLLVVALFARFTDVFTLSSPWDALESWWIIGLLLVLSLIEFFADKAPAVNHVNDLIQTFVRPAAGAIAFAASADVVTEINPVFALAMGLLVAGSVHVVKSAAVRPMVTATTAGTGNVLVSTLEDVVSTAVSILSVLLPAILLGLSVLVLLWILVRQAKRSYGA